MNKLDPRLKRLLKLSRTPAADLGDAPFGFSGRVVAAAKPTKPISLLEELQQKALGIACASLVVVVAGAAVLLSQQASAAPEPEISSAVNFAANNLLQ